MSKKSMFLYRGVNVFSFGHVKKHAVWNIDMISLRYYYTDLNINYIRVVRWRFFFVSVSRLNTTQERIFSALIGSGNDFYFFFYWLSIIHPRRLYEVLESI